MKILFLLFLALQFIPSFSQEVDFNDQFTNSDEHSQLIQRLDSIENKTNELNKNLENIPGKQEQSDYLGWVAIGLAIAGIATSSGAFIFAYKGNKEIQYLLHELGLDVKNILSGSDVKIETKTGRAPVSPQIQTADIPQTKEKEKISALLEKLPEGKLSSLLHEAKLIALELNDLEMSNWIQDELDGFQSLKEDSRKKEKVKKKPPENRMMTGHFYLASDVPGVQPVKITRRIFMSQPIAEIEDIVERHDQGKIQTTLPYTIENTNTRMDGEKVDLLLTREEWKSILIKTRQKLSTSLEPHLFQK